MKYLLKTDGIEFECSKRPVPKTAPNGVQKVDNATGWPVWAIELTGFTNEDDGSSGACPKFRRTSVAAP